MDNETVTASKAHEIVFLKFADAELPRMKEVRNKDWVFYGEKNDYPEYLTYLYNKSSKHAAIINGKSKYIFGGGFKSRTNPDYKLQSVNSYGETWDDISPKAIMDVELYGGYRLLIIWSKDGKSFTAWHIDYSKVRTGKEDGVFYYKDNWSDTREEPRIYLEFDITCPEGAQIYAYNEYRPGNGIYPLPEYIACNNYIETDIEISKFHLSAIRNGMMPSKMIEFFSGEPAAEHKAEIERQWKRKFAGSENAGRFMLVFSPSKEKSINISDLSASELDKQFEILNQTCQQEIFTGHQVVSPMLFGIKTEGQLGGSTELRTAYEIFTNTYAKPKQASLERVINLFEKLLGRDPDLYIEPLDPVGLIFDTANVISLLPKQFIYEKLNVPKEYWEPEIAPAVPGVVTEASTNNMLTNLTAKQYQQVMRIVREYNKEKLNEAQARMMLKNGFALTDEDVDTLLGIEQQQEFSAQDEDGIVSLFNACGDHKDDYLIVKSKKVTFSSMEECFDDETDTMQLAFATTDIGNLEADILRLIQKDKRITPEVLSSVLKITPELAAAKIASLIDVGYIDQVDTLIGEDTIAERTLTEPLDDILTKEEGKRASNILIRYSYEGPVDSRNRPFCAKIMKLNRLYSRADIESVSERLGYSVFDRRGGFWRHKDGIITPYCRHHWKSNIVVRKGVKK